MSDTLAHYGVKGMKWGQRKKHEESRKEYRKRTARESKEFYDKKANALIEASMKKGDQLIIATKLPGDYATTLTTGTQFIQHLQAGGVFDVKTTEIFATQPKKNSQFVENDKPMGTYKKTERR